MKIFYAVQATGNGHISRAIELLPYLRQLGEVDILLSGSNTHLNTPLPIKYRIHGLSLFYSNGGSLNYGRTARNIKLSNVLKDARALPLENYDLIINDFDFVTSLACRLKKRKSVQFGHQASFQSKHTPRPKEKNLLGELILKTYAAATVYIGLHFRSYDQFIFDPVIKEAIKGAKAHDHGHITVYLPAHQRHHISHIFKAISPTKVHWFLPEATTISKDENITFFPIQQEAFNDSLIHCHGIMTAGGFETPSEALYLKKKLLSIPITGQYEQLCNAAALKELGVNIIPTLNETTKYDFYNWVYSPQNDITMKANDIPKTLGYMLDHIP